MLDPSKNEQFQSALAHILRFEGGYVDHPRDPGGATKFGITRKTLARFRGISPWWQLPKIAVKKMGRIEAAQIYFKYYWLRTQADELPEALAFTMFDYAVNSGPRRAISEIQIIVRTDVDGIVGPKTKLAIKEYCKRSSLQDLLSQYIENRHSFLRKLKTYSVFGSGWRNRITHVKQQAAKLLKRNTTFHKGTSKLNILSGYKTYLVAIFMLISGVLELLGVNVPAIDAQNALQLVMEALAVLFLRKGMKSEIANA